MKDGVDLRGRQFGRWTVLHKVRPRIACGSKRDYRYVRWRCVCACGQRRSLLTRALTTRDSQSCGCLKKELAESRIKHGLTVGGVWRPQYVLFHNAKYRSRRDGIPFNIDINDIVIPPHCPVLGLPLKPSRDVLSAGSPSIDRKIPALGYVKGNVRVISHRANSLKRDATVEELELVLADLRNIAVETTL